MLTRITTGLVGIAAAIAIITKGGVVFSGAVLLLALVGWHEGDEFVVLVVVHERVVEKTVAVVVHEAALEYEGAVFGACYECVPDFCLVWAVSFYSHIPLHFLYALKSRI